MGDLPGIVFDPHSDQTTSLNADRRFVAVSLGKLYALLTLYKMASQGWLSLDDERRRTPGMFGPTAPG